MTVSFFNYQDETGDLVSSAHVKTAQLSDAKKLQMFSALACCARITGNLRLADRFFEYARQLSRIFYDAIDEVEEPFSVALGYCLMTIYVSAYSRPKGLRYISIAEGIVQQVSTGSTDPRLALRFFIAMIRHILTTPEAVVAVSCPIVDVREYYILAQEAKEKGYPPPPRPSTISITESYFTPSLHAEATRVLNPFFPLFHDGQVVENPARVPTDVPTEALNLYAVEFFMYTRTILCHFMPNLSQVFYTDNITEENLFIPQGVMSPEIADNLLQKITFVTNSNVPVMAFLGAILGPSMHAWILYSQSRFDECVTVVKVVDAITKTLLIHDLVLFSPPYLIPPVLIVTSWLLLQLGLVDEYDRVSVFLQHFAGCDYMCAKIGFPVLEAVKLRLFPHLETPKSGSVLQLNALGVDHSEVLLNSAPFAELALGEDPEKYLTTLSSPSTLAQGSTTSSLEDSPEAEYAEQIPMDIFFNFLDSSNEQKILQELADIFPES